MFEPDQRPLPYKEFKQLVRRYPRTPLLRALAAEAAAMERQQVSAVRAARPHNAVATFTIAGVARTCLRAANEYRDEAITPQTIAWLCNQFIQVNDPDATGKHDADVSRLLAKVMFEQGPSQYSQMENLARTVSLLLDHRDGVTNAPSDDDWARLLGVDVLRYMRIGFAAFTAVVNNGGTIARSLLRAPHVAPIFGTTSAAKALEVLDRHFVADLPTLRARCEQEEVAHRGREKWTFNPLAARPLVAIGDDLVAPVPFYLIDKIATNGLYYVAADSWKSRFTDALGKMFERYVGTQLRLLEVPVLPEIVYGKPERKTCDYIVIYDDVLLLVEAKSARPTLDVRLATDNDVVDLDKKLGRAREQIVTTASMIAERHPAVAHLPADRPMVGLVITLEPFHLNHTMRARALLGHQTIPIAAACAHDLEGTTPALAGRNDAGARLLAALRHPEPDMRRLRSATDGIATPEGQATRNRILDAAYQRWINETAGPEELARRDTA